MNASLNYKKVTLTGIVHVIDTRVYNNFNDK